MFINRQKELSALEKRYHSNHAELLVIYGRRRVGKTALLLKHINGKSNIFYMADRRSELEQLEIFSALMSEKFSDIILKSNPLKSWDQVFTYLSEKINHRKLIIVIDEFPYLAEVSSVLPSIIQKHWDLNLKNKNIKLILCGSSMSFMEKDVLAYKSPLYGRRTGQFEIGPFGFEESWEMFNSIDRKSMMHIYAVFGGIPAYLECVEKKKDIWYNISRQIFPSDKVLHNEVNFLLMQELRTPKNYFSILRAIALGNTKINDIVQMTQLDRALVGNYLENLSELRIVTRKVPVDENPQKSRKGIYQITDNYFRFWFRYVYPRTTYIEEGRTSDVLTQIKKDFPSYLGFIFEDVCMEYLRKNPHIIPFEFSKLGSWWDKANEIDIVALNEKGDLLVGECKYSNKKTGIDIYYNLIEKSMLLNNSKRKPHFILFTKSGFTDAMHRLAESEDIILVNFDEMF